MGDCDILRVVAFVLLAAASCSSPKAGQSNLLPSTDAGATVPGTRRPGDPQVSGAADAGAEVSTAGADSARPPAIDGEAPIAPDASSSSPADAPPAAAPDATSSSPADVPPAALPDAREADVGVTWDANTRLTDCGITKPWAPKKSYPKYEFVLNYGHIFQCLGEPPNQAAPSPFSDCKSPDYEPGKPGGPWADAWFDSGVCR